MDDFDNFVTRHARKIVILDEAQAIPDLFFRLRSHLDANEKGQGVGAGTKWVLLGSASRDLRVLANQNLAGRYAEVELMGLNISEVWPANDQVRRARASTLDDPPEEISAAVSVNSHQTVQRLWSRGGFPRSFNARNEQTSVNWRRRYLRSVLGALNELEGIPKIGLLVALWERISVNSGDQFNRYTLPGVLGCKRDELEGLLRLLEQNFLIRILRRWDGNENRRLDRHPKLFVRDSGLLHAQQHLGALDAVLADKIKGRSWEGFVLESLMSVSPPDTQAFYYHNDENAEVDIILDFGAGRRWAIEVKLSDRERPSSGFFRACEIVRPEQRFMVHGGPENLLIGRENVETYCLQDAVAKLLHIRQ